MNIRRISFAEAYEWCKFKHYARRIPSISYAFGLYNDRVLIGMVSYGTPPSPSLCKGICGPEYASRVLELNRLVVNDDAPRNAASLLVGRSLKMIPSPAIVVSFADTEQGHVGYIYQATNFIYTGLSAKRTNWKVKGKEHLHSVSIADMSRGQPNRAAFMREKFGDSFYLEERTRKHRYIYFVGTKRETRTMKAALKYKPEPYPKGETRRYDASYAPAFQSELFQ